MNKRIINLIIAVIFISATAFANNITSITTDGAKAFIVDTKVWKSEYVSVTIRDNAGVLIFEDSFKTDAGKRLNLKNLSNGVYSITLANNLKSTSQGFVVNATEIHLQPNAETIYKPVITVEKDHIDLNYLTTGKNTSVTIYDANNEIFNIDFDNKKTVNKRFDTSKLPKGIYTFQVSSDNEAYSESFQK